jgi:NAD(P)-dependent dehydrogenase (short-subunit alcohol dehydrogenase family)
MRSDTRRSWRAGNKHTGEEREMTMAKTILITGATDGIGKQTALLIAQRGHRVVLHGRNAARLAAAQAEVAAVATGPAPEVIQADLGSLAQVHRMAAELQARFPALDVLLNNAGVYMNELAHTADGFEMTFGVNHLAPFLLTHLLLDQLKAASGRVVNVSSIAHGRARLNMDNLNAEQGFDPYKTYALSKLANVLFTVELARRLGPDSPVHVNALHPGVVSTKLLVDGFKMDGPDSLDDGAQTSVLLALDPIGGEVTGRYFANSALAQPNALTQDEAACRAFYERSAELVGIKGI